MANRRNHKPERSVGAAKPWEFRQYRFLRIRGNKNEDASDHAFAMMFCLALSAPARAQGLDINLDTLSAKAKEKAEVTLEGSLLAQALQIAPANVKSAIANVTRVVFRHYEFATESRAVLDPDLDAIRKQVSDPWSRLLNVKEEHESTEIYMLTQGRQAGRVPANLRPSPRS